MSMSEEKFLVGSRDPETNETSIDFYEDKDKALRQAEMFEQDMPERDFYIGVKKEALDNDEVL